MHFLFPSKHGPLGISLTQEEVIIVNTMQKEHPGKYEGGEGVLQALADYKLQKETEKMLSVECGTPFVNAVLRAVEDYNNGRQVSDGITVDEVEVIILDDWDETGCSFDDDGPVPIYAPIMLVKGKNEPERLFEPTDIEGFTPIRGHEYKLLIRRIYLTRIPMYHHYELMELLSDKQTQ